MGLIKNRSKKVQSAVVKCLATLDEAIKNEDTEVAHCKADDALTTLLSELGFGEVSERFEKVGKWYA